MIKINGLFPFLYIMYIEFCFVSFLYMCISNFVSFQLQLPEEKRGIELHYSAQPEKGFLIGFFFGLVRRGGDWTAAHQNPYELKRPDLHIHAVASENPPKPVLCLSPVQET